MNRIYMYFLEDPTVFDGSIVSPEMTLGKVVCKELPSASKPISRSATTFFAMRPQLSAAS
jgi:hypothetical protein